MKEAECTICSCEDEDISVALAFIRGFSLGMSAQRNDTYGDYLRSCLCLRHCDLLQHHISWAERNVGQEPPWAEEEPGL